MKGLAPMKDFYHLNYPAENVFQCCVDLIREIPQSENLIIMPEIATIYVQLINYPINYFCKGFMKDKLALNIKVDRTEEQKCNITISSGLLVEYPINYSGQMEGRVLHAVAHFLYCLLGRLNYLYPPRQ